MSALELAIEKIKSLPEARAKALLDWLAEFEQPRKPAPAAKGALSVRGFARRFHPQPLTTNEWMKILREPLMQIATCGQPGGGVISRHELSDS